MKYIDSSAFVKYYALEELEKGNAFVKELINKANCRRLYRHQSGRSINNLFTINNLYK